jgi:glycosyltransferase involved in cell wall biosynthesis
MYRSNLIAGIFGKLASKPVVWNIRASSLEPLRLGSKVLAYAGGVLAGWLPKAIINCSVESARIHARLGYDRTEGAVIPNGYDSATLHPDRESRKRTRGLLQVNEGTFLIGNIARWDSHKDIANLLRAVRIAQERGIPARCMLIGRGLTPENPALTQVLTDFGCHDTVIRLGERSDVRNLMRAMDLHVLSSISEGFPNAVAESMLSGTPNVVTDVGDSSLIVADTGWVVPPRDSQLLADAIVEAYHECSSSADKWNARGNAARNRIMENFSLDRMAHAYEQVWRAAVIA